MDWSQRELCLCLVNIIMANNGSLIIKCMGVIMRSCDIPASYIIMSKHTPAYVQRKFRIMNMLGPQRDGHSWEVKNVLTL